MDDFKKNIRYIRLLEKRLVKMPESLKIVQRRTLRTAIAVLRCLNGLDFQEFSHTLFFLCVDTRTSEFNRQYEAQLELALVDEEKFVKNLHKFYRDMAKKIEDENLYSTFFQFMSFFCIRRYSYNSTQLQRSVAEAYMDLLLQQTEYLRSDLTKRVAGISTDGELLLVDEFMPFIDTISTTLDYESLVLNKFKDQAAFDRRLRELLQRQGLPPMTEEDFAGLSQIDRVFSNTLSTMSPYINEYTVDMLPNNKRTLDQDVTALSFLEAKLDAGKLKAVLKHRARTLPSNGVVFDISGIIFRVSMKEILFGNEIIMLYKEETVVGETSGFYNTHTGVFYSVLAETTGPMIFENHERFILYLYACAVLRNGKELLDNAHEVLRFRSTPLDIKMTLTGGKPRDMYHQRTVERDESKYHYEARQIQGYVRRLPEGQKASQEARDRALLLGFDLEENETYVQGFVKNVPCLAPTPTDPQ
jgi:hypothetical protein